MHKKLWALFGAASLTMSACGGSTSDSGGLASESETATTAPATTTPETTTSDTAASDTEPETTETTQAGDGDAEPEATGVREPLTLAPVSAGPLTITPTECTVEGAELEGPSGANSIAFAGNRLFVSNDAGVLAFAFSGPDCVLTLDTTMGTNGVMTDDDLFSSLSGTPDGRLAASGVLGSMVYDTNEGFSYECDMTGYVTLSPDGTTALMSFPGRDAIEQWTLTDTNCDQTGSVTFDGIADLRFVTHDGGDFLVGGANAEETVVVSRYRNGAPVWTAGSDEIGADDWWGWVHGMAPCGTYTCMIDTNTDAIALIGDDGSVVAAFDFSDLIGIRGWIEPIIVGPDGANYVLFDNAVDDENDVRTNFASIIRLEVTG